MDSLGADPARPHAHRHRLDDRARGRLRPLAGDVPALPGLDGRRAGGVWRSRQRRSPGSTPPDVVFSTHFDCVPPFVTSRVEGDLLYGRGSCDAKGTLAAQVHGGRAASRRRRAARRAWCSSSARSAAATARRTANGHRLADGCRYLVNGEPTDGRLATATRGILRVTLSAKGRAAHSSRPDLGESAIDKLLDALIRLRAQVLPDDPRARPHALHDRSHLRRHRAQRRLAPRRGRGDVPHGRAHSPTWSRRSPPSATWSTPRPCSTCRPCTSPRSTASTSASFPFTTDIPFLDRWGQPLLVGPGSVLLAHTDDEHVGIGGAGTGGGHLRGVGQATALETISAGVKRDDDRHVGDGRALLEKVARALAVYFFLLVAFRFAGKRLLAQLNPFDLVLILILSNAAAERHHRAGRQRRRRPGRRRGAAAGQRRHGAVAVPLPQARAPGRRMRDQADGPGTTCSTTR